MAGDNPSLKTSFSFETVKVFAKGDESKDGFTYTDRNGKLVAVLENLDPQGFYDMFWDRLGDNGQSAVIGSFEDQKRMWSSPPNQTETPMVTYSDSYGIQQQGSMFSASGNLMLFTHASDVHTHRA